MSENWEVVLPHRERLLRIARRRLPSLEDAEDCVQETLIRAACAAGLDAARAGQYLTSVLLRLCADHMRALAAGRRARDRFFREHHGAPPEEDICDHAEAGWIRAHAVDRLTARERDVLWARADGLSTREAARRLNISGKAAEAALTRARTRIRLAAA